MDGCFCFYQGRYFFQSTIALPFSSTHSLPTRLGNTKRLVDFNILEINSSTALPSFSELSYRHPLASLAIQENTAYIQFNSFLSQQNKQLFIYRFVVPALLKQQGLMVLHASAIVIDGQLTLIIGRSGSGKSFYAANQVKQGAQFYADDLLFIKQDGGQLMVSGGQPLFHLDELSLKKLGINKASSHSVHGSAKYAVDVALLGGEQITQQLPISRLLVLESAKTIELTKVALLKLLLESEYKIPWFSEALVDEQQKFQLLALLANTNKNISADAST